MEFNISPGLYVTIFNFLLFSILYLYVDWIIIWVPLGYLIFYGMYYAFDITIAFALTLIIFRLVWLYKNLNNPENTSLTVRATREVIKEFRTRMHMDSPPPIECLYDGFACKLYLKEKQLHVIENTQEKREFVVSAVLKNRLRELFKKDWRITYDELLEYCKSKNYKVIEKNKKAEKEDFDKVDINLAMLEEIQKLPGINIITAKKIIAKREELDGYSSIDEVLQVAHVSKRMEEMLRQRIMILPKMNSIYVNLNNDEREVDI